MAVRPITLSALTQGIQRLREKGSADPKTLYDLQDGYVTIDGSVTQRPGTELAYDLPAGTLGLCAHDGDLVVFSTSPKACPAGTRCEVLTHPYFPSQGLTYIWFAAPFLGYLYVAAEFENGDVYHYWLQAANEWEASTTYMEGQIIVPTTANGLGYKAHRVLPKYPQWSPGMEVAVGTRIEPTVANGYYYEASETSEATGVGTPGGSPNPGTPGTPPDGGPTAPDDEGYPTTISGTLPDGYVGVGYNLYLGLASALTAHDADPYTAYGGYWELFFTGEIVGNVCPTVINPYTTISTGIPLVAETRNADFTMYPSGPLTSGETHVTDSITIAAKPTYSLMNWSRRSVSDTYALVETTPPWTTVRLNSDVAYASARQISIGGASTGKVRSEFVTSAAGFFIGVSAAAESSGLAYGVDGHFAYGVPSAGTYAVELDADTGAIEVFKLGVGSVSTGTLSVAGSYDGKYRFAWATDASVVPSATIKTNMGNEAWAITPTVGYGGMPMPSVTVPVGWDAALSTTYRCSGSTSMTQAYAGPSSVGQLAIARSVFAKSSGKWRVFISCGNQGRVGLCKTGHTGNIGTAGAGDSLAFIPADAADRNYKVETCFGGVFTRTSFPASEYFRPPSLILALDLTANTCGIYYRREDDPGGYTLLTTVTGVPAGSWVPAAYAANNLTLYTPTEPATYDDWTVTV